MNAPLRFDPFLRPMVWGGRRLGDLLGKALPTDGAYGEAWEISDHPTHLSVVSSGPWRGRTLRQLMEDTQRELLGSDKSQEAFPWLVKLLDAQDWLSVQVHPDDEAARRLWPGERGKTEAWFILDAAPGSKVYAGLLPNVNEAALRQALAAGKLAECLHQFQPRPGDFVFLPAGTVHALGGGVLMAEVQQTSDATFRLYDWDRTAAGGQPRPLHVSESLACIDWRRGPIDPIRAKGHPECFGDAGQPSEVTQRLAECDYFVVDYERRSEPFSVGGEDKMEVVVVVHGQGTLVATDGPAELRVGNCILLPAAASAQVCLPEQPLGLMRVSLPQSRTR